MSNTRNLRSRFSSPATLTSANQENAASVQETVEIQQPTNGASKLPRLESWVEPTVRQGVPSFEDVRGLERVGVLEHMQPLGVAPNQKLLQRLKLNYPRASMSARATPVYSEGATSPGGDPIRDDVASPPIDPELFIETSPPPPATQPSHEMQPSSPLPSDATPQPMPPTLQPAQPQPPVIMSPPRGRPAKREVEEMRVYNDDSMMSPALTGVPRPPRASPRNPSIQEHQKLETFRRYIQNAISRASREGKPEVVSGLNKVLAESARDELLTAIENISKYKGSVRMEQFKVFKHYIKKGVRQYRRDSERSFLYDDSPGPPPQMSQPSQKPVAYVSSFHANIKRPSPTDSALSNTSPIKSPLALRTNHAETASSASPPKLSLHSPSLIDKSSMDLLTDQPFDVSSHPPLKHISRKRRSSSTSSLSSAISVPSSYAAPVEGTLEGKLDAEALTQAPEMRPTRSAGSRQAPTRAASSRATRLSSGLDQQQNSDLSQTDSNNPFHPNASNKDAQAKRHRFANQLPSLPDHELRELERRRQIYENQCELDYNAPTRWPTLDDRHKTESQRKSGTSKSLLEPRDGPPPPMIHPNSLIHAAVELSSPTTAEFPIVNGTSRKRDYDEYAKDDASSRLSSPVPSFASDLPVPRASNRLSAGATSTRASTPRAAKDNLASKTRKTPRTMVSPKKLKNGANSAGATRAGIAKDTVTTNGADASGEKPENEDQCRACGDEGLLLLCEGCPNSFHGECLEPPINIDDIEGDWYCPECVVKRRPEAVKSEGFMSALIDYMHDAYPRAYNLPHEVRSYFENVKTGDDGEYVEIIPPPTNKKGAPRTDNNGAMKPPNYKDTRDKHGNLRLCYKCGQSTGGEREMMPCDYCPNEWHLDCLDPPAPVIPKRFGNDGKTPQPWRCPLHIDHDLIEVGRSAGAEVGLLGRKPRLRRPKRVSSTMQPVTRPNPTNNGIIDLVLEPEEPELNVKTVEMNGSIFKIPEKRVINDFISKARWEFYNDFHIKAARGIQSDQSHAKYWLPNHARYRDQYAQEVSNENREIKREESNPLRARTEAIYHTDLDREVAHARLHQKSFVEQQTIINLAAMAHGANNMNGVKNKARHPDLQDLADQLIADAPEEVTLAKSTSEAEQLREFIKLAQQRLAVVEAAVKNPKTETRSPRLGNGRETAGEKVNGTFGHEHSE